jgi:hypothetical protein
MREPLQPIWDIALKHWDEVLPTASDYAAAIAEVCFQYEVYLGECRFGDQWSDADVLLATFMHCGYEESIPGLPIEQKHFQISQTLWDRSKHYRE